jgi:dTDP-4-amino-4,6-dideoxygalactose transaminase
VNHPHTILQANPLASYLAHQADIDAAVARVLHSGRYILGPETAAFEEEFARYLGARYAVGVGSGTEALHLALVACGVGPGDEVITVSHTAVATVAAIELCGAAPVLVDIEPRSFTLDPARIEPALTARTRAIVPVHLYGQPADLDPILALARQYNLRVIEDCAQAHGAVYRGRRVGTWGDIAAFSFYPTKNLGAIGDGGLVATNDERLAGQARLLRQYGWRQRYVSDVPGWNTRLDELQAAILRARLPGLDADNAQRQRLAALYHERLAGMPVIMPEELPDRCHVYHLYVIRCPRRDELAVYLGEQGIGTQIHYPVPIHLQPAYSGRVSPAGALPVTEQAAQEILSLPLYPELAADDVETVAQHIRRFYGQACT